MRAGADPRSQKAGIPMERNECAALSLLFASYQPPRSLLAARLRAASGVMVAGSLARTIRATRPWQAIARQPSERVPSRMINRQAPGPFRRAEGECAIRPGEIPANVQ